jgi:hypothetical protein
MTIPETIAAINRQLAQVNPGYTAEYHAAPDATGRRQKAVIINPTDFAIELNDVQTQALIRELDEIIRNDRYFLSPRIVVLKEILAMLRPEPARPAPLPPLRDDEPPSKGRYGRRR